MIIKPDTTKDIVLHVLGYGAVGLFIKKAIDHIGYKRKFKETIAEHRDIHITLHNHIQNVADLCREGFLTIEDIHQKMSQAKTNQNYDLDEVSDFWEGSVGLSNRFQMLLENCQYIQDRIIRCDQVIENTMGEFQGSLRFLKWSLLTLVSTSVGVITSRMVVSPIKKTGMFAAGGVLLGTGFVGLVDKCTSYEEKAMNNVWRKLRKDLNNLSPLQVNYAAFLKIINIEMTDYEKLTSDTVRYCINSTNDDNTRMNAQADKILRKANILRQQFTLIDNLFSDDHNQVHAEQDMFDIQDVFFLQDPSDLIDF